MATIHIAPNDRLLCVGMTGSGKTTLLRNLAQTRPYRIIIDTKQDPNDKWLGKKVTDPTKLRRYWNKGAIVYQPDAKYINPKAMNELFRWLYETAQDVLIVVDEAQTVGILNSTRYSEYADLILRQGRGRKLPLWMGSQRPMYLKNECISESQHIFTFRLLLRDDRKKMAGVCGPLLMNIPNKEGLDIPSKDYTPYSAWYTHNGETYYMGPSRK